MESPTVERHLRLIHRICTSTLNTVVNSRPCPNRGGPMFLEGWLLQQLGGNVDLATKTAVVRRMRADETFVQGSSTTGERLTHAAEMMNSPVRMAAEQVETVCAMETTNSKNSKRGATTKVKLFLESWVFDLVGKDEVGGLDLKIIEKLQRHLEHNGEFVCDTGPDNERLIGLRTVVVAQQQQAEERRVAQEAAFKTLLEAVRTLLHKTNPHESTTRKGVSTGVPMFLEKWVISSVEHCMPADYRGTLVDRLRKHPDFAMDKSDTGEKLILLEADILKRISAEIQATDLREEEERPFLNFMIDLKSTCDLSQNFDDMNAAVCCRTGKLLLHESWVITALKHHDEGLKRRAREHADMISGESSDGIRLLDLRSKVVDEAMSPERGRFTVEFHTAAARMANLMRAADFATAHAAQATGECSQTGELMLASGSFIIQMLNEVPRDSYNYLVANMKLLTLNLKANPLFVTGQTSSGVHLILLKETLDARRLQRQYKEMKIMIPFVQRLFSTVRTAKENARFCVVNGQFMFIEAEVLKSIAVELGENRSMDDATIRARLQSEESFIIGRSERGIPLLHLRSVVEGKKKLDDERKYKESMASAMAETMALESEWKKANDQQRTPATNTNPSHIQLFNWLLNRATHLFMNSERDEHNSAQCVTSGKIMFLEDWALEELDEDIPLKYKGNFIDRLRRATKFVTGVTAGGWKLLDHSDALPKVQEYKKADFQMFTVEVLELLNSATMTKNNSMLGVNHGIEMFLEQFVIHETMAYITVGQTDRFLVELRLEPWFYTDTSRTGERLIHVIEKVHGVSDSSESSSEDISEIEKQMAILQAAKKPAPLHVPPKKPAYIQAQLINGEYSLFVCAIVHVLQTAPLNKHTALAVKDGGGAKGHLVSWVLGVQSVSIPMSNPDEAIQKLSSNANFNIVPSVNGKDLFVLTEKGRKTQVTVPGKSRSETPPSASIPMNALSRSSSVASLPYTGEIQPLDRAFVNALVHLMESALLCRDNSAVVLFQKRNKAFFKVGYLFRHLPKQVLRFLARESASCLGKSMALMEHNFIVVKNNAQTVANAYDNAAEDAVELELIGMLRSNEAMLTKQMLRKLSPSAQRRVRSDRGLRIFIDECPKFEMDSTTNLVTLARQPEKRKTQVAPVEETSKILSVCLDLLHNAVFTAANSVPVKISGAEKIFYRIKWLYESIPEPSRRKAGDLKDFFTILKGAPETFLVNGSVVQTRAFLQEAASESQAHAAVQEWILNNGKKTVGDLFPQLSRDVQMRMRSKRGLQEFILANGETYSMEANGVIKVRYAVPSTAHASQGAVPKQQPATVRPEGRFLEACLNLMNSSILTADNSKIIYSDEYAEEFRFFKTDWLLDNVPGHRDEEDYFLDYLTKTALFDVRQGCIQILAFLDMSASEETCHYEVTCLMPKGYLTINEMFKELDEESQVRMKTKYGLIRFIKDHSDKYCLEQDSTGRFKVSKAMPTLEASVRRLSIGASSQQAAQASPARRLSNTQLAEQPRKDPLTASRRQSTNQLADTQGALQRSAQSTQASPAHRLSAFQLSAQSSPARAAITHGDLESSPGWVTIGPKKPGATKASVDNRILFRHVFYLFITSKYCEGQSPMDAAGVPEQSLYVNYAWNEICHNVKELEGVTKEDVLRVLEGNNKFFRVSQSKKSFSINTTKIPSEDIEEAVTGLKESLNHLTTQNQERQMYKVDERTGRRVVAIQRLMNVFYQRQVKFGKVVRILRKKILLELFKAHQDVFYVTTDGGSVGLKGPEEEKKKTVTKEPVLQIDTPFERYTNMDVLAEVVDYLKYVNPNQDNSSREDGFYLENLRGYLANCKSRDFASNESLARFLRAFPRRVEVTGGGLGVRLLSGGEAGGEDNFMEVPEVVGDEREKWHGKSAQVTI